MQPSPVVKASVLIDHRHDALRSDQQSQSQEQRPQLHNAHLLSLRKPGAQVLTDESWHSWWSLSFSNWWHGRQDWYLWYFSSFLNGVLLMKESDLHMSDGEVRTPCTSSHCSARQISCELVFLALMRGWCRFVATVGSHVQEEVGDKTCGSERLQQRRNFEKGGHGDRERSEQYNRIRARSARNMLYLRSFCGSRALIMGVTTPMARCQEDSLFICTPCFILL